MSTVISYVVLLVFNSGFEHSFCISEETTSRCNRTKSKFSAIQKEKPLALVKGFSMSSTRFTGKNVINNDIEREYIDPRDNG